MLVFKMGLYIVISEIPSEVWTEIKKVEDVVTEGTEWGVAVGMMFLGSIAFFQVLKFFFSKASN